jgi:purine-binding chemotaxis protein CheW
MIMNNHHVSDDQIGGKMERQLVIFELGKEQFGVDINLVEGIEKALEITKIPQGPWYMEGITNLRNTVLPVMDLQKRFQMVNRENSNETRIVIVNIDGVKVGMVVSAVSEVLTIDDSIIEPPPPLISSLKTEYITGVAKVKNRLVILLNLSKILTEEEKEQVSELVP